MGALLSRRGKRSRNGKSLAGILGFTEVKTGHSSTPRIIPSGIEEPHKDSLAGPRDSQAPLGKDRDGLRKGTAVGPLV